MLKILFPVDMSELVDLSKFGIKFKMGLSIEEKYNELDGASGFLGAPLDGEKPGAKGGKYREYKGGSIYWHPSIGAHVVHGDILAKYKSLGAENSFLGYPTADVLKTPDGRYYSMFEGGVILSLPPLKPGIGPEFQKKTVRAVEVHGAILSKYMELKAYAGPLGYPSTDELDAGDGIGKVSYFEGGAIFWTPETGAHEVHGAILQKYSDLGKYYGFLGYPKTDELKTPDGIGRYNHFQGGSIYWTPTTGAHEVHGAIYDKWAEMGWEKSWLGYPTSDEFSIPGTNGKRSIFVGGAIDWFPGKGAKAIKHFYDLKALDWCYKLDPSNKNITFYAVVANVGTQVVHGPGELAIGVTIYPISYEKPRWANKIPADFKLAPGNTNILGQGVTVPFGNSYDYSWLEYRYNIAGETPKNFCDSTFLNDLKSGKNNNGRSYFVNKVGADVGSPKNSVTGAWIVNTSGKQCSGS